MGDLAGRRTLDVGAARAPSRSARRAGARVWASDPPRDARGRAGVRRKRVGLSWTREELPFRTPGSSGRARLVVHLFDRQRAVRSSARPRPRSRAVIATFTEGHFEWYWLPRCSEVGEIDRMRFPTPEALEAELARPASLGPNATLRQRRSIRRNALERIRGRYISTLDCSTRRPTPPGWSAPSASFRRRSSPCSSGAS